MKAVTQFLTLGLSVLLALVPALCHAQRPQLVVQTGHTQQVEAVCFSPDGRTLASGSDDRTIKLWGVATGRLLRTFTGYSQISSVCFSPVGGLLAGSSLLDGTVKLWDAATGRLIVTLMAHPLITSVCFSPDGKTIASGSADTAGDDRTITLWDTRRRRRLDLEQHNGGTASICFSPDGNTLASGSADGTIKIWEVGTGKGLGSLHAFDDGGWAVLDPDGRFDGDEAGLTYLHWVVGLEPIDLSQLKERYYEPGLLAKLLGFDKTPLRDVPAFDNVRLYPSVDVVPFAPGSHTLTVHLTNQGGGIGPVQVYVNGQIYREDARPKGTDPNLPKLTLTVDLAAVPNAKPGQDNAVKVVALNYDPQTHESYLQSRGCEAVWTAADQTAAHPIRHLYGIIVGVSDYASPSLRLGFAAKDADSFANALELAADGLFTPARVHITRLNTTGKPGALPPTKANIQAAFAQVKAHAGPEDILVVYLAGHGIALPAENSLYCYLTADARTGDTAALNDPVVRGQMTVTALPVIRGTSDDLPGLAAKLAAAVADAAAKLQ